MHGWPQRHQERLDEEEVDDDDDALGSGPCAPGSAGGSVSAILFPILFELRLNVIPKDTAHVGKQMVNRLIWMFLLELVQFPMPLPS